MEAALAQAKRYGQQCRHFIDNGMDDDYERCHKAFQAFRRQCNYFGFHLAKAVFCAYYEGHYAVRLV